MKIGLKFILKPTPTNIKHIVDSINGALSVSGLSIILENPGASKIAIAIAFLGFILKAMSNMFSYEKEDEEAIKVSKKKASRKVGVKKIST